ncbi:hypothetical protein [Gottfriedia acidiceleris]|uniref:hypothetical protein n=1 Tax=Gottfriedia acidiceleris TaxID=371036 RepID=UPI00142FA0F5|nr:hypothetical protein [Gottfriedia acidiceleris]
MAYDVLIFFFFVIILLGMIWALFLLLKNGLNVEDSLRIDPKLSQPIKNEHS